MIVFLTVNGNIYYLNESALNKKVYTAKKIPDLTEVYSIKKVNQLQRKPPTKRTVSAIDERGEKVYSFSSMTKAAKVMQVSSPAISSAVKNKTKCKGFRWIIDEEKGYDL